MGGLGLEEGIYIGIAENSRGSREAPCCGWEEEAQERLLAPYVGSRALGGQYGAVSLPNSKQRRKKAGADCERPRVSCAPPEVVSRARGPPPRSLVGRPGVPRAALAPTHVKAGGGGSRSNLEQPVCFV